MVRRSGSFALLFFALVPGVALAAFGQAAAQSSPPTNQVTAAAVNPVMPKDANAAMLLAARVNGLASPDMKPWHLKANYQTFDADGKPKDQGVFEEWWAGPEKYKISYASSGFNQVQYRDGEKTWMVGDVKWPTRSERLLEQLFVHPLPPASEVEGQKYVAKNVKDGAIPLMCLHQETLPQIPVPGFCFTEDLPAVRYEEPYGGMVALFNRIVRADNHYTAKEIRVQRGAKPILNGDLVDLDFPPKFEDTDFVAPASASLAPAPPEMISTVMDRVSGAAPKYPPIARAAHVFGTVVLEATITKKGDVADLEVISGPPMLQQAAVDAVKTWKYKPYTRNGEPLDVETQLNVVFTLVGGFGGGVPDGRVN